jgi:ABC-type sugar transport system ATPase subunit
VTSRGFSPTGIRFENIEKRYGGLAALRRIRFEIAPGECVALAGRNGSGKTRCYALPLVWCVPPPAN